MSIFRTGVLPNLFLASAATFGCFLLIELLCQTWAGLLPAKNQYLAHRIYTANKGDLLTWANSERYSQNNYANQYDSVIGWIGKPNIACRNWSIEQEYDVTTNSEGFRDIEHEIDAAPEVIRIAILGDSFIWGQNLNQDQLMPQVLQSRMAVAGWKVEVFNFGIMGYGNDQEFLLYKRFVKKYKPDIVALSFFYSNDFWNNYEEVSSQKAKPYFRLDSSGELHLMNVPVPRTNTVVEGQSQHQASLFRTVKEFLERRSFIYNLLIRNAFVRSLFVPLGLASPVDTAEVQRQATIRYTQESITKAILLEMNREVNADGAKFFVFMFPGYGYYHGNKSDYYATKRFFAEQLANLELLDLTPFMDKSGKPCYQEIGEHWNAHGASVAAEAVASHLEKYLHGLTPRNLPKDQ